MKIRQTYGEPFPVGRFLFSARRMTMHARKMHYDKMLVILLGNILCKYFEYMRSKNSRNDLKNIMALF